MTIRVHNSVTCSCGTVYSYDASDVQSDPNMRALMPDYTTCPRCRRQHEHRSSYEDDDRMGSWGRGR